MAQRTNGLFRRGLAMLLSMAMLLSLVVLPAGATGTGEGQTVAAAEPSLKFELPLDNVNYYEGGETVLVHGNWLNYYLYQQTPYDLEDLKKMYEEAE